MIYKDQETMQRLAFISIIKKRYIKIINYDTVLKLEFSRLIKHLRASDDLFLDSCQKIIDHMLIEIHKPNEHDRLDAHSNKLRVESDSKPYLDEEYFQLKCAMDHFYREQNSTV